MPRLRALIGIYFLAAVAAYPADPLDGVFARIDAAAKSFKGMTADLTDTEHHAIVPDDDDVQSGTIKLSRNRDQIRMLIAFTKPSVQTISYDGKRTLIYHHRANTVDQIDMTKYQGEANQYLLLGFGANSAELKATYAVSYVGEEKIVGAPTSHLKLVPKSANTLHTMKQSDLWFGANGLVAQQKFLWAGDGDYKLVTYSNVKQGALEDKDLELKLPKDVAIHKQ